MSGQMPLDKPVTRAEFSRLEAKMDQILGHLEDQASSNSSTYDRPTPSGAECDQYDTTDQQSSQRMIFNHIDRAVEQLEARLCARLTKHSEMKDVKQSIEQLKGSVSQSKQAVDEIKKTVKDNMYTLKREIFAFTEKECQIVRDRIEGPLPSHKLYTLDFYVEGFKSLIKSGVDRYSPPWHINQFKSSLQGNVQFLNNGKLSVWMIHACHPREVGLQPRKSGSLKMKATISDGTGQLADMEVGEETGNFSHDIIKNNSDWGHHLGEIECQKILDAGYADIQNYINGAVLVRYMVEVL